MFTLFTLEAGLLRLLIMIYYMLMMMLIRWLDYIIENI